MPAVKTVHLPYSGAFDWPSVLAFLSRRAIPGMESVVDDVYQRTVRVEEEVGTISVSHDPSSDRLVITAPEGFVNDATGRLRRMFDLEADLQSVNAHLARDPFMAVLVGARPALRVPGGWDPFEVAVRAIIGQQVSVARARQLNRVLVERCGPTLPDLASHGLRHLFPTPQQVVAADLSIMGMPGARVAAVKTVASAAVDDPRLFERGGTLEETVSRLQSLRGIGDWTAHYIAMRASREPDAFPASDVGLLRGAAVNGQRPTPAALLGRAEAWRPWRAYAAHHLWAVDSTASDGVQAAPGGARLPA